MESPSKQEGDAQISRFWFTKNGRTKGYWVARAVCVLLGLVFLAAGLAKATDMGLFVQQIKAYQMVTQHQVVVLSAWALIVLECGLGVALLLGYRLRVALLVSGLLLLFFIALTGWAWHAGTAEICGCFGSWAERSPGEEAVSNLVLLVLTGLALVVFPSKKENPSPALLWGVLGACLASLALPVAFGFPVSSFISSAGTGTPIGPITLVDADGKDLEQGLVLVVVMDTECDHCQAAVPGLNKLTEQNGALRVVALCLNDATDRANFVAQFKPKYPIYQVRDEDFWRILGDGMTPHFVLARDGHLVQTWDRVLPDTAELTGILE